MRLRRTIALSVRALLAHRLRTALILASVAAGVAAVVLTSAIGAGAARGVEQTVRSIGANLLVVRPVEARHFVGRKEVKGIVTTLTLDDWHALDTLPQVAATAPGIEAVVPVKGGVNSAPATVLGTTTAFPAVRRFTVSRGRFFDDDDDRASRRVAVLGARVADALFDGDAVGRQIRVRGVPFNVIGVLAAKGVVAGGDEDNLVVVPVRTALRRVFNVTWLSSVFVSARDVGAAQASLGAALGARHRLTRDSEPDFEIQNPARLFAMQQRAADGMNELTSGIGAITLLVGGAGIMGLMLMSVKERTPEIGLRIAVGARRRDILAQFLIEATLLALGGWAAGAAVGAALVSVVALATSWTLAAPFGALALSFGMAVVMGTGFGAVPARRASTVAPIEALVAA